jgi:twitching motility protein PilT
LHSRKYAAACKTPVFKLMSLVPSLLQAIVQLDGEALVMHVGDKPYVVSPTGQVDLATRGLSLDAVVGVVNQLLPIESQQALDEFGAAQYELPALPEFPGEQFTIVAARGGDDVWAEVRRRRVSEDDRVPMELFGELAPPSRNGPPHIAGPSLPGRSDAPWESVDIAAAGDDLVVPDVTHLFPGAVHPKPFLDINRDADHFRVTARENDPPPAAAAWPPPALPPATARPPLARVPSAPTAVAPAPVPQQPATSLPGPAAPPAWRPPPATAEPPIAPAPPIARVPSAPTAVPTSVVPPAAVPQRPVISQPGPAASAAWPPPPLQMPAPSLPGPPPAPTQHAPSPVASAPVAPAAPIFQAPPLQPPAVVLPLARNPILRDAPPHTEQALAGLDRLLRLAAARGASTLYLSSASRPSVRVDGDIYSLEGAPILGPNDVESLLLTLMPERNAEALRTGVASEWICDLEEVGRVRCMSFRDHRGPGGVFRMMPVRAVTAEQLGLSPEIQALAIEPEGLVIVSGPRSSGKRTLMSALVDLINRTRRDHVITIETEINVVHERNGSFISQREVRGGSDDMVGVARAALREDPDILVLEEVRTPALMNLALDAAGKGQLVIGGFPAHNASGAVDRIIDLYPSEHRRQVQLSLAQNLRGVVAQVLLRKTGGGRVAAREILLNTPAVASALAEGKTSQLPLAIEGGRRARRLRPGRHRGRARSLPPRRRSRGLRRAAQTAGRRYVGHRTLRLISARRMVRAPSSRTRARRPPSGRRSAPSRSGAPIRGRAGLGLA